MKSAGEKFKFALSIQFYLVLFAGAVSLFVMYMMDEITFTRVMLVLVTWYASYLPVMFADVLASIEKNTEPINYEKLAKALREAQQAPTAKNAKTQQNSVEIREASDEPAICPSCGTVNPSNRKRCEQCGNNL